MSEELPGGACDDRANDGTAVDEDENEGLEEADAEVKKEPHDEEIKEEPGSECGLQGRRRRQRPAGGRAQ